MRKMYDADGKYFENYRKSVFSLIDIYVNRKACTFANIFSLGLLEKGRQLLFLQLGKKCIHM